MNRSVRTVKVNSRNPDQSKDQVPSALLGGQQPILSPKKKLPAKTLVNDAESMRLSIIPMIYSARVSNCSKRTRNKTDPEQ